MDAGSAVSTREPSAARRSSPPTFDNQRQLERASLPPRPNGAARHAKRLTLNFPINIPPQLNPPQLEPPSEQSSPATNAMSPMTQSSFVSSPSRPSSISPGPDDPAAESYGFLTALAAQERKVLELREELSCAEAELATLKRQWAMGEKGRKRTEILHHAEALKPLKQTQQPTDCSQGGDPLSVDTTVPSNVRLSRELERKNSIRNSGASSPVGVSPSTSVSSKGRRVFQGSKHARTLSLLSPDLGAGYKPSFPQPNDVDSTNKSERSRSPQHPRSSTLPSVDRSEDSNSANTPKPSKADRTGWRQSLPPIPHDVSPDTFMKTGKQMASDFREGLWTFFEDIRQATVGEEAISGTESRSMQGSQATIRQGRKNGTGNSSTSRERSAGSSGTGRSNMSVSKDRTSSKSGKASKPTTNQEVSFWSEFGIDAPDQTGETPTNSNDNSKNHNTPSERTEVTDDSQPDVDDNWDVWDTPQPKTHTPSSSSSTFPSKRDQSPSTAASSPRTSTSFADISATQNESVPGANKSDAIPWPALTKLHPSKLTKTASNLMAEWERSLTPPNERSSKTETLPTPDKGEQKND